MIETSDTMKKNETQLFGSEGFERWFGIEANTNKYRVNTDRAKCSKLKAGTYGQRIGNAYSLM